MGTDKRARQKANRQARLEREQQQARRDTTKRSLRRAVVYGLVALGLVLWLSSRGGGDDAEVATTGTATTLPTGTTLPKVPTAPGPGATITGDTPCPAEDGSAERTTTFEKAPPMCLEEGVDYVAVIETDRGQVQVALDTEAAPQTANNFAVLARYHYYDGTALFRTDQSIDIIQGGAPFSNSPGDQGPGYTIQDEATELTYQEGDLVMARTAEPNSAGAQFFFGAGPNVANLNFNPEQPGTGTYVRFGRVIAGLEVLQAILASHVDDPTSGLGGYPSPPVVVTSIVVVPADQAPTPTTMAPGTTAPVTTIAPGSTVPVTTAAVPSTTAAP